MAEVLFDQNAWLKRIGYSGPLEPTLSALNELIFAFARSHAIAYESLDIMLGRTPRLDLGSLQRKMILGGRGGYCLEQNMLFREGLRHSATRSPACKVGLCAACRSTPRVRPFICCCG